LRGLRGIRNFRAIKARSGGQKKICFIKFVGSIRSMKEAMGGRQWNFLKTEKERLTVCVASTDPRWRLPGEGKQKEVKRDATKNLFPIEWLKRGESKKGSERGSQRGGLKGRGGGNEAAPRKG